jgi:hypothetical protein
VTVTAVPKAFVSVADGAETTWSHAFAG